MNLYAAFATWLDQQAEHEVTPDHLKLLARLNLCWCSYAYDGAPGVDPKRPFGNEDTAANIAEILRWPVGPDGLTAAQRLEAVRLYCETLIVLQILAARQTIEPGRYHRVVENGRTWLCTGETTGPLQERNRARLHKLSQPQDESNWPSFLKTR